MTHSVTHETMLFAVSSDPSSPTNGEPQAMTELETLKSILTTFVTTLHQSGIITPATGEKPLADHYALSIEALSKRVTTLEAALSQAHDTLESYREDSFARNEVADLVREQVKEWLTKNPPASGVSKQDLDEEIASYLNMNDYLDSDSIESKVEDMIDSHDFSTSPKMKRMVQDVVDEADLEDAVKNALEGMNLNRHLDLSDLASDLEGEIDFDSKVSDALDSIELSDKLDILFAAFHAPAVREQVDEALADHDFSEALRNTLSDPTVREALLKMLLEDLSKKLTASEEI